MCTHHVLTLLKTPDIHREVRWHKLGRLVILRKDRLLSFSHPPHRRRNRTTPNDICYPTEVELRAIDIWDQRNEGVGLIQLAVKNSIRPSIRENETLVENWKRLKDTYGIQTGLNLWVDITKYFATSFSQQQPLIQQIDKMSEFKSCIDSAGMTIPDSLHAMFILCALPSNYEVIQQTANTRDYKMLTSTDIRSRLQNSVKAQPSVSMPSGLERKPRTPKLAVGATERVIGNGIVKGNSVDCQRRKLRARGKR